MGMYLLPYAVDIEKVKSTFNSHSDILFENIKKNTTFKSYASQGSDQISSEEALRQIIFGEELDKKLGHVYGYTLIGIVAYWGIELAKEGDIFKFGSVMDEQEGKLKELGVSLHMSSELMEPIYNFGLPRPADFPIIGGMDKSAMIQLQKDLNSIEELKNNFNPNDFDDLDMVAISVLKRGVNLCVNRNLDWISFVH